MTAEVRPQVSGIIQQRLFTEGALVKQGQQLYQIDAASLKAAEASAAAAVAMKLAPPQARNGNRRRDSKPRIVVSTPQGCFGQASGRGLPCLAAPCL